MGGKGSGTNPNSHNIKGPASIVPETNQDAIGLMEELFSWPMIDLSVAGQIRQRYAEYLDLCKRHNSKPLISGLALAMGTTRSEYMRHAAGKNTALTARLTSESDQELKRCFDFLEVCWEQAMQNNGYRQPVAGIFLGKNNFGYKDTSETIVHRGSSQSGPSRAELEAKYSQALPQEAIDVRVEVIDEPERPKPRHKGRPRKQRQLGDGTE